jgi:hypothetical protein
MQITRNQRALGRQATNAPGTGVSYSAGEFNTAVTYLGKEANRLEDVAHGLIHDLSEVVSVKPDCTCEWNDLLQRKLVVIPRAHAAPPFRDF